MCLVGPAGAGKSFLAEYIASNVLHNTAKDAVHVIRPNPTSISIEQIRGLQSFLTLKQPGKGALRRVVIIEQAHTMGEEAQNASLKVLEEPPADAVIILTTDGSTTLKPTIYSRVQQIHVLPVSLEQATQHFAGDISKSYHLSGGLAGLLYGLVNDQNHELVTTITRAKDLMRAAAFERLLAVDSLAKDKASIPQLLYAMERVLSAALAGSTTHEQTNRLVRNLRSIYDAKVDLAKSANPKLLLTDLFLAL